MTGSSANEIVHQLLAAAGRDESTDGDLLARFALGRDGDALAALVERHAPMVWGVCARTLRNPHDAQDAFQATFLVLVQKAATVKPREMVANWLYGVARQTAVRLRSANARRGWRELQANAMPEPVLPESPDVDLLSLLDQELARLPERHRALIVLCDLEGLTRKEAARQLGCPEGTVASGLVRARELLAKRLNRYGLVVSGGTLAALSQPVASADVPPAVVTAVINLATRHAAGNAAGVMSGPVAALTNQVVKAMLLKKLMTTLAAGLALGVAVVTGGSLVMDQTEPPSNATVGQDAKPPEEKPAGPTAKPENEYTAWGKEVGGLQAGIRMPGGTTVKAGASAEVQVVVKNVGERAIEVVYVEGQAGVTSHWSRETGRYGIAYTMTRSGDAPRATAVQLKPGQEFVRVSMRVRNGPPAKGEPLGEVLGVLELPAGAHKVGMACVGGGLMKDKTGLDLLSTGDLEVRADPPRPKVDKPPHAVEKPDMKGRMESRLPWKLDREPTEETIRIATKTFVSDLNTHPQYRLREFFDPRYLKKHGLADKEIAFEVVGNYHGLHNYAVADDDRTILCTLERAVDGNVVRELFLFRWVYHDGCLYVSPEKAPDPKTGIFTPWILRTKP